MDNPEVCPITADLYFLLHKFLSGGPLKKTLKALHEELTENKLLPQRTDWLGKLHDRTLEDLEHQYPNVRPDYLLQLCCRAGTQKVTQVEKIATLFSLKKHAVNSSNVEYNFKQLCNYVQRRHLLPLCNRVHISSNLVNILRGREISGPISRRWVVAPKLYSGLQFQRRTLGHLSAVYCLLFDYSGRYIITGADDLLIKLWSSVTGRLIATFRGASSEITDIAINLENTLLAAGSIDRILRIWDLQTGIPVAVLPGHTGMITSVNFCPSPSWNFQYLITTSTDGSVAFWAYTHEPGGKVNFHAKPTMYQEKMRPGQAQMICSSFSPGGNFLATGSADHHVRVYYMKGDEGPHRILETEAHNDRVDSIQWAHEGLKFLSGSKDGTAIIWSFESQQWKTTYLHMTAASNTVKPTSTKKMAEEARKLKVTMVTWDRSDAWAITAVSDHTLKIWNVRSGQLDKILTGHTDEIYVLESHPHDRNVILSAGHDGQLFIWDLYKGEIISRFNNTIENQGYGAIFDVKWSPDGNVVAASDSHGHLLIFGFGTGDSLFEQLPKELFFHTDYRPLVRDTNNYVLDEQTQIPPHLMPPPFLVDIDGNPYPPMLQRLVPGREHCNTEQLVPNVVIGNEGTQEVIQEAEVQPSVRNHLRPQNHRNEGIRQSTGDWQSDPNMKWKKHVLVPPLKDTHIRKIKEDVEMMENMEMQEYKRQLCQRPHMITVSTSAETSKSIEKKRNPIRIRPTKESINKPIFIVSASSSSESESDSTGYSDWVAEEDVNEDVNNRESPKRTRRRQVNYNSESDDHKDESRENTPEKFPVRPMKIKDPERYRISEWLTEVRPRKTPYFPQMGDELVYFPQGHHLYLEAVRTKKIYEINSKTLPWTKMHLRSHEFVKVIGIQYEVKPPRLCNLRLALLDDDGRLNGKIFTVKYHDMPDVLDFFVLKQHFDCAISRNWEIGDKFRCMIDDGWWIGEIVAKNNASGDFPESPFLCYEIKWDNDELERMSPWDMEALDDNRVPENSGEALPVLEEELQSILYQPTADDWPNSDREAVTCYILTGLAKVMELAIAEPFLVPVDLNTYPTYAVIVEYPVDLSTIKARFENRFYRRLTAAQFDVRHLAANAEKFNERHSIIVKHARILTELCLRIIKQCSTHLDVTAIYHQLVDTYDSTDTEVDVEIPPSSSRMLRSLPTRYLRHASDWKSEAKILFQAIWDCEDSVPFRTPVNNLKYTDYHDIIETPMDLSTVKDKLFSDKYETPNEFYNDMRLIFQNSRTYNTNKRSRIYVMTVRLAAIFEEHISKLIKHWKMAKRRSYATQQTNNKAESGTNSSSSSSELSEIEEEMKNVESDSSDSEDNKPLKKLQTVKVTTKVVKSEEESESESSESVEKMNEDGSEEDESNDSEDSCYKPVTRSTRKRNEITSSEEEEDEEESSDDSDDKPLISVRHNGRAKKRSRYVESESEDDKEFFTSVSSRGRVRKLNPRVTALMKK
ncbi:Bromodomain and WD repeat-containing protein 3-like Protein [Tribolium castaneum]|uniref:Bromodomain and WD repeat-containing protein 3-like Protein n=1 Tax=Tribolium castaneum TaxID=7070 RepID=D6X562_TRICA|nr:PREDICTED: PH-interacting protein [Tribolium castaneum]EEZ97170.1 Bromodomain and WD repeat-containing protein 3-like Protein [Tribolium castaneum]|eukprot:XP_008200338.1 PREDICTED: PH-interacting protein [Tribolium castaneum]